MKLGIFGIAALAAMAAFPTLGFSQAVDDTVLMINEIQYDPVGTDNNTTQEWIELFNNSNDPIDLTGYKVTAGSFPEFTFPTGATISPRGFVLLVGKKDEFLGQYQNGVDPSTVYDLNPDTRASKLGNSSATVSVFAPGEVTPLDTVTYARTLPWPDDANNAGANNLGPTLELTDPAADNTAGANWKVSDFAYGSPGKMNSHAVDATISGVARNFTNPAPTDTVTISATVTSVNPLGQVQIVIDSGSGFQEFAMVANGGGQYSYSLGTFPEGTLVKYYIRAVDSNGLDVTFPDLAPLRPAAFHVAAEPVTDEDLVISEIMYNPQGTDNGTNSEYIELYNRSANPIDLSYYVWDRGDFDYIYPRVIPEGTVIAPNGYVVLVGRGEEFKAAFPTLDPATIANAAWPSGGSVIVNGGGNVSIAHANDFDLGDYSATTALDRVPFTAVAPWPTGADGKSIELIDASSDNAVGSNWGLTTRPTGTPGQPNTASDATGLTSIGAFLENQYPELNEDVIIGADITGGVDPVTAQLFISSGAGFVSYPMTNNGGGDFSVNLGQFSTHTAFEYYMQATDSTGYYIIEPQYDIQRFIVDDDPAGADDLVINELMYNNQGGDNGTYSEWIEVYNRRATPINMTFFQMGTAVDAAISTLLPQGTIIPGNGFLIFAGDKDTFLAQYPAVDPNLVVDSGWTPGSKLGNTTGSPAIVHANAVLWMRQASIPFDIVPYTVGTDGWPADADGISFQLKDPALDNSVGANWEASAFQGAETPAMPNNASNVSDWSVY